MVVYDGDGPSADEGQSVNENTRINVLPVNLPSCSHWDPRCGEIWVLFSVKWEELGG